MSLPKHSLGWDDTIKPSKPFSLSHNFNGLSLSPENKRKRRHEDPASSASGPSHPGSGTASPSSAAPHLHSPQPAPVLPPSSKRSRISQPSVSRRSASHLSTRRRLEALDSQQLIALLEELVDHQPQLCYAIDAMAPPLTAAQAVAVLQRYLHAVEERLPYGGGQSDYSYLRVRPQWTSFFVTLADYTHFFLENADTDVTKTLEFLDGATSLVHRAPVWDSAENNALLARAYGELSDAWASVLGKAQEALSYMFISGSAWEARFQDHCERSRGRMVDTRSQQPVESMMMRIPESVIS